MESRTNATEPREEREEQRLPGLFSCARAPTMDRAIEKRVVRRGLRAGGSDQGGAAGAKRSRVTQTRGGGGGAGGRGGVGGGGRGGGEGFVVVLGLGL